MAVLAAALVFTVLNTGRIGTARVGLSAILSAGVLMYVVSGHLPSPRWRSSPGCWSACTPAWSCWPPR
jgi:hypothetical protein